MPRYFFHHRIGDRMMWDAVGLDLPDLKMALDPERAVVVWMDIIEGRIEPGRILVVTDAIGKVLFVTAR